jgi:hypothetical protein
MNIPHTILYATIAQWELTERLRRDEPAFDGWKFIAEKIGHKSASTLRKMCLERSIANAAKLGYDEAIIIMSLTNDYRLLHAMKARLIELRRSEAERRNQLNLFSEPIRSLEMQ